MVDVLGVTRSGSASVLPAFGSGSLSTWTCACDALRPVKVSVTGASVAFGLTSLVNTLPVALSTVLEAYSPLPAPTLRQHVVAQVGGEQLLHVVRRGAEGL